MTGPLVSVVMPCYNAESTLCASIDSTLGQSVKNFEIVAVDDGSSDQTLITLERYAKIDGRIRVLRQANGGPAKARNTGITSANGTYLAFLDSDDTWESSFIEDMLEPFVADQTVGLTYCGWQNTGLTGGRGAPFIPPDYETEDKLLKLFTGCRWPIHATLMKRELLLESGLFDTRLRSSEDFELWIRIAGNHKIARVPKVLAYYHHHPDPGRVTHDKYEVAVNHFVAQQYALAKNPALVDKLKPHDLYDLMHGELLHKAYECYWARNLLPARKLFRKLALKGRVGAKDMKYVVLSFLPLVIHRLILGISD